MTGPSTIPFNALGRAVEVQRADLDAAIGSVLDSGWFVMGPQHDGFEHELAAYLGVDHCVAVANGTDALELALLAVGCRPGDTVVAAANAGGYGTAAARKLGLRVRYADVDADTLQMDTTSLEAELAHPARAVVLTHLYGHMAPVEQVRALCDRHGVALVEDCAQAAGAHREGRYAGSFGDAATFSFYPTKNLGALGDGGAVVTSDASRAEELRRLRQYGWSRRYVAETAGGRNSRLDEMQAAVLRVRLPLLDAGNRRRRDIAQAYAQASAGTRVLASAGRDDVAHLVVAVPDDRSAFTALLDEAGVCWAVHFPLGDHRQPVALADGGDPPTLPTTEWAGDRVVSLPCFPEMTDDEVERVCDALRRS